MPYRNFSNETEKLSGRWVDQVVTDDHWHVVSKVSEETGKGDTESSPLMVQNGPFRCVAKPSAEHKPRAAHEKIVSDLAYHLSLPVPPTLLWKREDPYPGTLLCGLSVFTGATALIWSRPIDYDQRFFWQSVGISAVVLALTLHLAQRPVDAETE